MHEATEASHALTLAAELEGELVLLWDLAAGHARSARFAGEIALEGHVVFPVRMSEGAAPLEFVGDYEISGAAEVALENE